MTELFTVNNVGDPEAVVVKEYCARVVIGESPAVVGWPTTDYVVRKQSATSDPRRIFAGTFYTFENPRGFWRPGDVCGYVETVSGTTTFIRDEG